MLKQFVAATSLALVCMGCGGGAHEEQIQSTEPATASLDASKENGQEAEVLQSNEQAIYTTRCYYVSYWCGAGYVSYGRVYCRTYGRTGGDISWYETRRTGYCG